MPLAPDVYGEIAALLRKAAMKLSSEVGLRLVRGAPKEWLADGRAVAAHGCRCAPAEPGWADAECHRRPPAAGLDLAGGVRAWIDAVEIGNEEHRVFKQRLVDAAGGAPGSKDSNVLKVRSLSASHTNWTLRLVACSARHASAGLCVRMPQP